LRKIILANQEVYHIISRSIAGYEIFSGAIEYSRFVDMIAFYQKALPYKYSIFQELTSVRQSEVLSSHKNIDNPVTIIAYCLMPTHIHIIIKQNKDNGISRFMSNLLNSYSRYFNIKHKRKGPLWEGRFGSVHVDKDVQLLHLTRYIHLNPSSAGLVEKPEEWIFSSYHEYVDLADNKICDTDDLLEINSKVYRKFVNDRVTFQRELSKIKKILLENYTG
jgi:putative transposase